MKRLVFLLLLLNLFRSAATAQTTDSLQAIGTVFFGLGYAQPTGNFREAYPGGQAAGGNLGILFKPNFPNVPFETGLAASHLVDGITLTRAQGPTPAYTIKTTHNYFPLHALVRAKPRRTLAITPYFDALAGITVFTSRSKIKQNWFSSLGEEEPVKLDRHNATVFSYGLAAGLQFGPRSTFNRLDLRVLYLESPRGTYVKRGRVTADADGYPVYALTRSETSMWQLQVNFARLLPGYR